MNSSLAFRKVFTGITSVLALLAAGHVAAQDVSNVRLVSAHADCSTVGVGNNEFTVTINGHTLSPTVATTQACVCGSTGVDFDYTDAAELANINTSGVDACGDPIDTSLSIVIPPETANIHLGSLGVEITTPGGVERLTIFGDLDNPEACQAGGATRGPGPFEVGPPPPADQDGDGTPDCIDTDIDGDGVLNDVDNCPLTANPGQEDADGDNTGDVCDFAVNAVPLDPFDRLRRHDIMSDVPTTLKAACTNDSCVGADWEWDPGDGSAVVTGTIAASPATAAAVVSGETYYYSIWTEHTYTCAEDDVFNATVTVSDGVDSATDTYRMVCRAQTLPVEVNAAIDEALWHIHRNQYRFDGTALGEEGGGSPMSRWDYPQTSGQAEVSVTGASINALEANGYREDGPTDSPYSETVARGLKYNISFLQPVDIAAQAAGDPDTNGNGIGIGTRGTNHADVNNHHAYKLGMVMDAIIASGTPGAVATTGPADVIGRTYGDIVQDMVDYFAWSQSDAGGGRGSWDYSPNGSLDNSAAGWSAIGMVAAEDVFGSTVPGFVRTENEIALETSDTESDAAETDGQHGYRSANPLWGPYGVTGAAMVQMVLADIEASTGATPDERWVRAENFFRRDFNDAASGNNFKNYYYALFNFAKAMRTARPAAVVIIGNEVGAADGGVGCGPNAACAAGGPNPLDWYNDPTDGLARLIVDYTIDSGPDIGGCTDRAGNSHGSNQDDHNTPWCAQILTQTLFQAGPVARADAAPNPGAVGQTINFDGSASFHQDPSRSIVMYEWDYDNDGVFVFTNNTPDGASTSYGALGSYPVTLRVTDDNDPALTDTDVVVVEITIPPHAPTADVNGPYLACIDEPVALDGSGSFDIDEGESESGSPPFDTITAWDWDLDGDLVFDDASGEVINNTYNSLGVFEVGLRVTDNTAAAFPSAGEPDLTDTDFTTVTVLPSDDPFCADEVECPEITVRPKSSKNQLVWEPVASAASYTIMRSTDGPASGFAPIAEGHVTDWATYLDEGLTNGVTYYYMVVAVSAAGGEICTSDVVDGTPQGRRMGAR